MVLKSPVHWDPAKAQRRPLESLPHQGCWVGKQQEPPLLHPLCAPHMLTTSGGKSGEEVPSGQPAAIEAFSACSLPGPRQAEDRTRHQHGVEESPTSTAQVEGETLQPEEEVPGDGQIHTLMTSRPLPRGFSDATRDGSRTLPAESAPLPAEWLLGKQASQPATHNVPLEMQASPSFLKNQDPCPAPQDPGPFATIRTQLHDSR